MQHVLGKIVLFYLFCELTIQYGYGILILNYYGFICTFADYTVILSPSGTKIRRTVRRGFLKEAKIE